MADITDYIEDTSILQRALLLLNNTGVHAAILDSCGAAIPLGNAEAKALCCRRFYPFEHTENIGGLVCYANDEPTMDKAQEHAALYVEMINMLLQRELEVRQMTNEILDLSEQINFLVHLAQKTVGINNLSDLCELLASEISQKIGADYAFISVDGSDGAKDDALLVCHNVSEHSVHEVQHHEIFLLASHKGEAILSSMDNGDSLLVSPITAKEGAIGHAVFVRKTGKRFFTAYEKKLLSIISSSISSIVETLRLYGSLRELYLNTVKALAAAIDAKDPYTHGHSFRVAKYSMAIARELGYPEENISEIEMSAYMHDLGKIGVSETVLRKPGKLTSEEFEEIKKHPGFTGKILQPIHLPDYIVKTAMQHHERIDGKGYPFGLSGEEIIPPARIVAVADVFDALTSERPYRPAMTVEDSLDILCKGIDTQFDKKMVIALINALKRGQEIKELADVYPDLKLSECKNLNNFLLNIVEELIKETTC